MATATSSELVVLSGGLSVRLEALRLLWALEGRAMNIWIDDRTGMLRVGPRAQLTDADREAIRAHRDELLALVRYCEGLPALTN